MAAITTAVVATAITVKGQRDQKKAQKRAAQDQRAAAIESANILASAGREAEAEIMRQNALAAETAALASIEAQEAIAPFADMTALEKATEEIIGNLPVSGAIADSIRQSSIEAVRSRPEFQMTGPIAREVERQGDLAVGAATPGFRQNLVGAAQEGLAATTDIAGIRSRGLGRLSDIAGGQAAQRASILVGQTPSLVDLSSQASEARILGDIAGQQGRARQAEAISGLAGQLFGKRGLIAQERSDEFGFKRGEDPFML